MPKVPPPKEYQFKKGQSGNPQGGKLMNSELRAIRRLTAAEVAAIGTLILSKNVAGLRAVLESAKSDPNSKNSVLKTWIAAVAIKGIAKGDPHALDILLNRLIGKTADHIKISDPSGGPIRALVGAMTPEERRAELVKLKSMREEAGED